MPVSKEKIIKILQKGKVELFNRWRKTYNIHYINLEHANLQNVDLSYINFSNVNLDCANFSCSDLSYANFSYADLVNTVFANAFMSRANLEGANLKHANFLNTTLRDANLNRACLFCADLYQTHLECAQMKFANLYNANLQCADLRHADLHNSDLYHANFKYADLVGANLTGVKADSTTSFFNLQCPEEGSFIGWKKCVDDTIIKLLILEDSQRSSATSRKCRASKVKVLNIYDKEGKEINSTVSIYNYTFIYRKGEVIKIEDFEKDRWRECAEGIHFFLTREEAENY